jgi:hypothetical protein
MKKRFGIILLLVAVLVGFPITPLFAQGDITWQQPGFQADFLSDIAASSDGTKVLAVGYEKMFKSTDSGVTWTEVPVPAT